MLVSTPAGEPAVKVLRRGDGVLETEIGRFHATCAQVTADGYLLTAGHCLPADRDLHVSIHGFRDGLRKARTVKVWGKPIDLALLKIDSPGPAWFPLGPAEVADRDLVISAGLRPVSFSIRLQTDDLVGVRLVTEESPVDVTAGHAVKVEPFTRQTGFRQLTTTMPLVPGNSGGAVIDASGRLLAINTRMDKVPPAILGKLLAQESHAYATLLDPAEVESAIEEDRRHGN